MPYLYARPGERRTEQPVFPLLLLSFLAPCDDYRGLLATPSSRAIPHLVDTKETLCSGNVIEVDLGKIDAGGSECMCWLVKFAEHGLISKRNTPRKLESWEVFGERVMFVLLQLF